jgi:hypothetical protein
MSFLFRKPAEMPTAETALPGRDHSLVLNRPHLVLGTPLTPPFPDGWHDEAQHEAARASQEMFQAELGRSGYGTITTEIAEAGPFYYAEDYHQQYLAANPNGYCGLGGTGVSCPMPVRRLSAP